MTTHDDHQRLERLERELADAFDVSPSPDLVPRIRERLADHDMRPRISVPLMAACACAVAGLSAALLLYPEQGSDTVQRTTEAARVERPAAPDVTFSDNAAIAAEPLPGPTQRAPRTAVVTPQDDALRPSSDLGAIEQFLAAIEQPSVDVGSLAAPPPIDVQVAALSIAPITIPAIVFDE